eukprot:3269097-Rhodomonas_salina.2
MAASGQGARTRRVRGAGREPSLLKPSAASELTNTADCPPGPHTSSFAGAEKADNNNKKTLHQKQKLCQNDNKKTTQRPNLPSAIVFRERSCAAWEGHGLCEYRTARRRRVGGSREVPPTKAPSYTPSRSTVEPLDPGRRTAGRQARAWRGCRQV